MQVKSWNKWEGTGLNVGVPRGIIIYDEEQYIEMRCDYFPSQLQNKMWLDKAVNCLRENGLIHEEFLAPQMEK